ncbi:inositol hexakisphosphate kinase 3 isoform X2 [Bombina bombina]|nr:inositol hexakisphosphate kinase 3 isoform X2 [Bombina bombina]
MGLQEGMEPENSIPLLPLCHQVGGHASMLCYDNDTICKPLVSQEQRFYETLPREMRDFTPRYKGMIFVSLQRDSGGNLSLIANPDACSQFDAPGDTSVALWRKVRWRRRSLGPEQGGMIIKQSQANTANINSSTESSYRTESCFHSGITYQVRSSRFSPADQDLYNPWGLHCHRRHLSQMSLEFNKNQQHRYLLLENVASKFSLPCILDLKMGIRQHGDDASDEKKARHMEKCAKSTSASLGVRICGMQNASQGDHSMEPNQVDRPSASAVIPQEQADAQQRESTANSLQRDNGAVPGPSTSGMEHQDGAVAIPGKPFTFTHDRHDQVDSSLSESECDSDTSLGLRGKGQKRMFAMVKKMWQVMQSGAVGSMAQAQLAIGSPETLQSTTIVGDKRPPINLIPERKVALHGDSFPSYTPSLHGHLKPRTIRKIQQGKYVNIFELSAEACRQREKSADGTGPKRFKRPETFEEWLICFRVFSSCYLEKYPSQCHAILKYTDNIHWIQRKFAEGAWRDYDAEFRQKMAGNPVLTFDTTDSHLWQRLGPQGSPSSSTPSSNQSFRASKTKRRGGTCWAFQDNKCDRGNSCAFRHVCRYCAGSHSGSECARKKDSASGRAQNKLSLVAKGPNTGEGARP